MSGIVPINARRGELPKNAGLGVRDKNIDLEFGDLKLKGSATQLRKVLSSFVRLPDGTQVLLFKDSAEPGNFPSAIVRQPGGAGRYLKGKASGRASNKRLFSLENIHETFHKRYIEIIAIATGTVIFLRELRDIWHFLFR